MIQAVAQLTHLRGTHAGLTHQLLRHAGSGLTQVTPRFRKADLQLTLVTAARTLCAEMPPQVGVTVRRWLEERDVTLHFEERAEPAGDGKECMLSDGTPIVADIVYQCTGGAPETSALRANWTLDRRGRATVNTHLQLLGAATDTPHIYAMGDMIALPADATCTHAGLGHTAELNAHVAAENVRRSSEGRALLEYPEGAVSPDTLAAPARRV